MNETKQAIRAVFIEQYKKQPFDKISVKGLCSQVPVARTTFYEYYSHLGALKTEIEDELISGMLEIARVTAKDCFERIDLFVFFEKTLKYIQDHWNENYAFLVSQPNLSYISKWKDGIKYHFALYFPEKQRIVNYNLILEVVASSVISAYIYWMKHLDKVDIKRMNEISVQMLNAAQNII